MGEFDDIFGVKSETPASNQQGTGEFDDIFGISAAPKRTVTGTAKDLGITALKGAIGVGEAVQGLADIPTGGRVGKFTEGIGYKPKQAKEILDTYLSPAQQAANKQVEQADGFVDTVGAAVQNPSTILHAGVESLPMMGAGGVAARGLMGALGTKVAVPASAGVAEVIAPKVAPWIAGAFGEGLVGAGSAAEQIRQQTEDGLLTAGQALAGVGSGLGTGAFNLVGGRLAQKFGFADPDTLLAQGLGKVSKEAAEEGEKGVIRRIIEGGISEGVFEEMPQSAQEQVWQNAALGKPLTEGVGSAMGMGMLTGAAMGAGVNMLPQGTPAAPAPPPQPEVPPNSPLTRATSMLTAGYATVPEGRVIDRRADPEVWARQEEAAKTRNEQAINRGDVAQDRAKGGASLKRDVPQADQKLTRQGKEKLARAEREAERQSERAEFEAEYQRYIDPGLTEQEERSTFPATAGMETEDRRREGDWTKQSKAAEDYNRGRNVRGEVDRTAREYDNQLGADFERALIDGGATLPLSKAEEQAGRFGFPGTTRPMTAKQPEVKPNPRQREMDEFELAYSPDARASLMGKAMATDDKGRAEWLRQEKKALTQNKVRNFQEAQTRAQAINEQKRREQAEAEEARKRAADPLYDAKQRFQESYDAAGTIPPVDYPSDQAAKEFEQKVRGQQKDRQHREWVQAYRRKQAENKALAEDETIPPEVRKQAAKEAEDIVTADPVYGHMAEAKRRGKLNLEAFGHDYDKDTIRQIIRRYPGIFSQVGTVQPDDFASEMGYASLDDMVRRFSEARTKTELTAQIIRERTGEWQQAEDAKQADDEFFAAKAERSDGGARWKGEPGGYQGRPLRTKFPAPEEEIAYMEDLIRRRPDNFTDDDLDHWTYTADQQQRLRAALREAQQSDSSGAGTSDNTEQGQGQGDAVAPDATPPADAAAADAAHSPDNDLPDPTDAQKEAGNYKKAHVRLYGLDISIENPAGSTRSGVDPDGKRWEVPIRDHYGYIKGTVGKDKDHLDVFIPEGFIPTDKDKVFVVNQIDPKTGKFDEHKIVFGSQDEAAARTTYLRNYDKTGPSRIGSITEMPLDEFKGWLDSGDTTKPASPVRGSDSTKDETQPSSQREDETQADLPGAGTVTAPSPGEASNTEWQQNADMADVPETDFGKEVRVHSYSNTQVRVTGEAARMLVAMGREIPERELYIDPNDPSYGRETEPHITVRYGLAIDDAAPLAELSGVGQMTATFGKVSIFAGDKYDVVKVEVISPDLHKANKKVGNLVDVPGETFKDYQPHATIAYVKPGEGKKYVGRTDLEGIALDFDEIDLVNRDGETKSIRLQPPDQPEREPEAEVPETDFGKTNAERPQGVEAELAATSDEDLDAMMDDVFGEEKPAAKQPKAPAKPRMTPLEKFLSDMENNGAARDARGWGFKIVSSPADDGSFVLEVVDESGDRRTIGRPYPPGRGFSRAEAIGRAVEEASFEKPARQAQPKPPKTAGQITKQGGIAALEGVKSAMAGLNTLFGGNNRLGSGLAFDEDTYTKAKPHFVQAWNHAKEAGYSLKELLQYFHDQFGKAVRPYLERFLADVKAGNLDAASPAADDQPQAKSTAVPDAWRKATIFLADYFQNMHEVVGWNFKNITEARAVVAERFANRPERLPDTTSGNFRKAVEEAIETAVVRIGRDTVSRGRSAGMSSRQVFDQLVELYEKQPKLGTRTSDSVRDQAYSTPVPVAFLANTLGGMTGRRGQLVFEPTAGTGMLTISADRDSVIANEMNPDRAAILRSLGIRSVIEGDALDVTGYPPADVVMANPPFGTVVDDNGKQKIFDVGGFKTAAIDHAISLHALEQMDDSGTAVLIIGGANKLLREQEDRAKQHYGKGRTRRFFKHLYDKYNVTDHFTIAGELYEKQGAGWPIDVIVITGKGQSEKAAPSFSAPPIYSSFDEIGRRLDEIQTGKERAFGVDATRSEQEAADPQRGPRTAATGRPEYADNAHAAGQPAGNAVPTDQEGGGRGGDGGQVDPVVDAGRPRPAAGVDQPQSIDQGTGGQRPGDGQRGDDAPRAEGQSGASRGSARGQGTAGGVDPARLDGSPVARGPKPGVVASQGQTHYQPTSGSEQIGTLTPQNMALPIQRALGDLAAKHGSVDAFVQGLLKYPSTKDLHAALSAEQVDAVALALDNVQRGAGFVLGDQTGIGKGRVVASMIRYAYLNGKVPVFITEKQGLYADMYRDLMDIGMDPSIVDEIMQTNSDEVELYRNDDTGELVSLKSPSKWADTLRTADGLPTIGKGNKAKAKKIVFTTYDQMNVGAKEGDAALPPRRRFLRQLVDKGNAMLIMDESHNAGGSGDLQSLRPDRKTGITPYPRALFFRHLIEQANGVIYSSATYAKSPEVMSLYSATDLRLGVGGDISAMAQTVTSGGIPFQQITASMLAESGQYIRRERSFEGVSYTPKVMEVDAQAAESVSSLMSSIRSFEETFITPAFENDGDAIGSSAVGDGGEKSQNFTALMHNIIDQMLLGLKVKPAVEEAIAILKAGAKNNEQVVLTVSNTMGSFIDEYAEATDITVGDEFRASFGDLLQRYLYKTREYRVKDNSNEDERFWLSDTEIGPVATRVYNDLVKAIAATDLSAVPVSPVDFMLNELSAAGFPALEITGRNLYIDYSGERPILAKRPAKEQSVDGRTATIKAFNSGKSRAIILNRSGSTGISLHASERNPPAGRGKRTMIIVQAEKDINVHMQMLGRVHRTGQVVTPAYIQAVANIPAERKVAAVLVGKMSSLNANTTADKDSPLSDKSSVDFLNKYGDRVASAFLRANPMLNATLGWPYGGEEANLEGLMKKVTGRLPLLPIAAQEYVYQALADSYSDVISELDATGRNDLEAKTFDLDAKVIDEVEVSPAAGASPFQGRVVAEKVDMKRIGKPYSSKEIDSLLAESDGEAERAAIASATDRFDEFERDVLAQAQSRVDSANTDAARAMAMESMDKRREELQANRSQFQTFAEAFKPGETVSVDLNVGEDSDWMYGIVLGVVQRGEPVNPLALSTWRVRIAVADGIRVVNMPFSRFAMGIRGRETDSVSVRPLSAPLDDVKKLFDSALRSSREQRWIITGNLFTGYSLFRAANGRIINFTRDDGSVAQGILMPARFSPQEEMDKTPVAFENADQAITFMQQVGNAAVNLRQPGELKLVHLAKDDVFRVSTQSAVSKAGRFFRDDRALLDITGRFTSLGNRMITDELTVDQVKAVFDLFARRGNSWFASDSLDVARGIVNPGTGGATAQTNQGTATGEENITYAVSEPRGDGGQAAGVVRDRAGAGVRAGGDRQLDLFTAAGIPVLHTRRAKKTVYAQAKHASSGTFSFSGGPVRRIDEIAGIAKPIMDDAQESNLLVMLDENDVPVAVLKHSVGGKSSGPMDPGVLLGVAHSIKAVKTIWSVHNHPSGSTELSAADRNVATMLSEATQGTGLNFAGIIAVTADGRFGASEFSGGKSLYEDSLGRDAVHRSGATVRGLTRKIKKLSDQPILGSSTAANDWLKNNANGQSGVILLDNRNRPAAFVPMSIEAMGKLRTGEKGTGASELLAAAEQANATGVMVVAPQADQQSEESAKNVAVFATAHSFYFIDAIVAGESRRGDIMQVLNDLKLGGGQSPTRAFYSKGVAGAGTGQADIEADLSSKYGRLRARRLLGRSVTVLESQDEARQVAKGASMEGVKYSKGGLVQGFFLNGRIYLVRDGIQKGEAADVLEHEIAHATRLNIRSTAAWGRILRSIEQRTGDGTTTGKALAEALALVPEDTAPGLIAEETLAYLIEKDRTDIGLVRRFIAMVKKALVELGFNPAIFTAADFKALAASAARSAAGVTVREQIAYSVRGMFKQVDPDSPALRRWQGNSQVTEPVYHGSPAEFWTFDKNRAGENTSQARTGLGFFFAMDRNEAAGYAGPGGSNRAFYVKIENPRRMNASDLPRMRNADEAQAFAKRMQLAGHDGIILEDEGHVIVFEPTQVKSAEINTGAFDGRNPDVRYSIANNPAVAAERQRVLGDQTKRLLDSIAKKGLTGTAEQQLFATMAEGLDIVDTADADLKTKAWDWFKSLPKAAARKSMGALTLRQLRDVFAKNIPQMDTFYEASRAIAADANRVMTAADQIYNQWARLDKKDAKAMSEVMIRSTIAGVNPDVAKFEPRANLKRLQAGIDRNLARAAEIRAKGDAATDDEKAERLQAEAGARRKAARIQNEVKRRSEYEKLATMYQVLSKDAKEVYQSVRKQYDDNLTALFDALKDRVERQIKNPEQRKHAIDAIRLRYDKFIKEGPYFPLSRFGDYIAIAETDGGERREVRTFDSMAERTRYARQRRAEGWTVQEKTKKEYNRETQGASGTFFEGVIRILNESEGLDAAERKSIIDEVNQHFIKSMPDLSHRKHFVHRRKVEGYSRDQMRAFADNMQHAAHHIARIRHADKMTAAVESVLAESRMLDKDANGDAFVDLHNELVKRLEIMNNPNISPATQALTSFGFLMNIGPSIASALVNISQTPLVAFPVLANRFKGLGAITAMNALTKASADYFTSKPSLASGPSLVDNERLPQEERDMVRALIDDGTIDVTQAHSLAQAAGSDYLNLARTKYGHIGARAMRLVAYPFHIAELANRKITALAAYRMARKSGMGHNEAVAATREAVLDSHFDYSQSNRARWMEGNVRRVLLLFKQYSQQMTWLLGRSFHQAAKGETKEVRQAAARQLGMILAGHFMVAGAMGLPVLGGMVGALSFLGNLAGDDDEPKDLEVSLRNFLADTFGTAGGDALMNGPWRMLPGLGQLDVANRMSLGDLWFRAPNREMEGRDQFNQYVNLVLGPVATNAANVFMGANSMANGEVWRGIEMMLPKAVKDGMKAIRYSTEGVKNWKHDTLLEDLGAMELFGQALGFTPARVSEMYAGANAVKNYETRIERRRKVLMNQWVNAVRKQDAEGAREAMVEITAFNAKNPIFRIDYRRNLVPSLRNRMRVQSQTKEGVYVPATRDEIREVGRFANI